jgi:hypothetical protein
MPTAEEADSQPPNVTTVPPQIIMIADDADGMATAHMDAHTNCQPYTTPTEATLFRFHDTIITAAHNTRKSKILNVSFMPASIHLDVCAMSQNSEKTEDGSTWIIGLELKEETSCGYLKK